MMYGSFKQYSERVIISTIGTSSPTREEFDEYIKAVVVEIAKAPKPFVWINDVSNSKMPTPEQKMKIGTIFINNQKLLESKLLGLVYIIPSPILRLVLRTIFLMGTTPPIDYVIVSDKKKAVKWAKQKLIQYPDI